MFSRLTRGTLSLPILTTTPLNIFRLEPYKAGLQQRYSEYKKALNFINQHEGGLDKFSQSYKTMGFQVDDKGGVSYREWAPGAVAARLIGDFSELLTRTRTATGMMMANQNRQLVAYCQPYDQE